jgi:uncharacterized membrane protein YbaN (DUF454 family)
MKVFERPAAQISFVGKSGLLSVALPQFRRLADLIRQIDDVFAVSLETDANGWPKLVVQFDRGVPVQVMLRKMADHLRASLDPDAAVETARGNANVRTRAASPDVATSVTQCDVVLPLDEIKPAFFTRLRWRRFVYGPLAVGAFGMAWVGLVVPGIPTVPFVILAAAFAAGADEKLHRRMVNSRVLGPIMKDWEEHQAIRPEVRVHATVVTVLIVAITLMVTPGSPELYSLIFVMLAFSLFVIWKLPVIRDSQSTESSNPRSSFTLADAV